MGQFFLLLSLYCLTVLGTGSWMYLHNGKISEAIVAGSSVAFGLLFLWILVGSGGKS